MAEEKKEQKKKEGEKISEKVPEASGNAVTVEVGLAPPNPSKKISISLPPGDPPPYPMGERRLTGKRGPRLDGPQKVTGRAVFTHDARRRDMLHGRILRSPHAHAKIVSIDVSAAERIPGVVIENPGKDVVRYHGDAVLALAAPSRAAAEDALHAVRVTYDVLPHTVSLAAARLEGAPLVFQKPVEEKRKTYGTACIDDVCLCAASGRGHQAVSSARIRIRTCGYWRLVPDVG